MSTHNNSHWKGIPTTRDSLTAAIAIKDFIKENYKEFSERIKRDIADESVALKVLSRLHEIPEPFLCHPLEIDLLFDEVLRGGLEWLYQEKIGNTKLGDVVKQTGHHLLSKEDAYKLEALRPPSRFWQVSVLRTRFF